MLNCELVRSYSLPCFAIKARLAHEKNVQWHEASLPTRYSLPRPFVITTPLCAVAQGGCLSPHPQQVADKCVQPTWLDEPPSRTAQIPYYSSRPVVTSPWEFVDQILIRLGKPAFQQDLESFAVAMFCLFTCGISSLPLVCHGGAPTQPQRPSCLVGCSREWSGAFNPSIS